MTKRSYGPIAVGILGVIALVAASVVPSHAWQGHRHGGWGPRVFVGARVVVPPVYVGPRFVVGVPYAYPYRVYSAYYPVYAPIYAAYPPAYGVAYGAAVIDPPAGYVERDAPAAQGWYYCHSPQGYYPVSSSARVGGCR